MTIKTSFQEFTNKYEKQIKFIEVVTQLLILIAIVFLISQKYFLQYKVVLVEKDFNGEYNVVKELIINGKLNEPKEFINTSQEESNHMGKLIIENRGQDYIYNDNSPILYNIST